VNTRNERRHPTKTIERERTKGGGRGGGGGAELGGGGAGGGPGRGSREVKTKKTCKGGKTEKGQNGCNRREVRMCAMKKGQKFAVSERTETRRERKEKTKRPWMGKLRVRVAGVKS